MVFSRVRDTALLTSGDVSAAGGNQISPITAVQSIVSASTAIDVSTYATVITTTPISTGNTTHTMANGTTAGQIKLIRADGAGAATTATVTPTNLTGGTSVVLSPNADNHLALVMLGWNGASWVAMDLFQAALT